MATTEPNPTDERPTLEQALAQVGHDDEVPNYERGCGFLDPDSTYLRTDVPAFASVGGTIPTFVEFDRPIPYREGHFRTFKRVNGTEFLLDATQAVREQPAGESVAHRVRVRVDAPVSELPEDEVLAYIVRAQSDAEEDLPVGSPFLDALNTMDLLMWVGQSYYETPAEFIREARTQGVNKKIPASGNQEPPAVRPFRTRLFLIHPRAIPTGMDKLGEPLLFDPEDDRVTDEFPTADPDDEAEGVAWTEQVFIPGIVGYTYLTRTIHTSDVDGEHPEWVRDFDSRGLLDAVNVGAACSKDSDDHPENAEDPLGALEASREGRDTPDDEEPESEPAGAADGDASDGAESGGEDPRREALEAIPHQKLRSKASEYGVSEQLGEHPTRDALVEALLDTDIDVRTKGGS